MLGKISGKISGEISKKFIALALNLSKKNIGNTGSNPVVGCVIVKDGQILSTGITEIGGRPHAEIVAIRKASEKIGSWRLDDLTLIVTLEPCVMCAGAILQSRIKRLVFGAFDQKAGAVGSSLDVIRDARALSKVEVVSGVLEKECAKLLTDFFATKR